MKTIGNTISQVCDWFGRSIDAHLHGRVDNFVGNFKDLLKHFVTRKSIYATKCTWSLQTISQNKHSLVDFWATRNNYSILYGICESLGWWKLEYFQQVCSLISIIHTVLYNTNKYQQINIYTCKFKEDQPIACRRWNIGENNETRAI